MTIIAIAAASCVQTYNNIVGTVCTYTTVRLPPRCRLLSLDRNQKPRLLCLAGPGRPACTAAEEARGARFPTIC